MPKLQNLTRFCFFTEFNSNLGWVTVDCNTFYCHLLKNVLDVDEVHEMHTCAIIIING